MCYFTRIIPIGDNRCNARVLAKGDDYLSVNVSMNGRLTYKNITDYPMGWLWSVDEIIYNITDKTVLRFIVDNL